MRNVMKRHGSIDELAVRQFVKEHPKMVEQLLVRNGAVTSGASPRQIASELSGMYPQGMIKGPVAYERGLMSKNQRDLDKYKNWGRDKDIISVSENQKVPGPRASMYSIISKGQEKPGADILLDKTRRQQPISYGHEISEAKGAQRNETESFFVKGDAPGAEAFRSREAFNARPSSPDLTSPVIGNHMGPNVLREEAHMMKKIPRYIDDLQEDVGSIRSFRDFSREYGAINKKPTEIPNVFGRKQNYYET